MDVDQSYISELIITSAMKGLQNVTESVLEGLNKGEWATYGGKVSNFGQLRYEKNVNGTGLVKLNTANPNGYKWVSDYGYQAGVTPITTAGTYVGSEYYAYETTLYANTLMPRAISVVDVNTGEYTAKREIENSTTEAPLILDEMTYDPKTNRIFGLHYDTSANKSYIYEIDRKTLDIALVATIDKVLFYTLAADPLSR